MEDPMQQLQNEVAAAISADLPRMLRSDVTRLSEMIAKYVGTGAQDAVPALVRARTALLEATAVVGGHAAPPLAGPGVDSGPETEVGARNTAATEEPWARKAPRVASAAGGGQGMVLETGGKDTLLTEVLTRLGFVSSSGRAKAGIRGGHVRVNGEQITHDGALLAPGTYEIRVGEDSSPQQVTVR